MRDHHSTRTRTRDRGGAVHQRLRGHRCRRGVAAAGVGQAPTLAGATASAGRGGEQLQDRHGVDLIVINIVIGAAAAGAAPTVPGARRGIAARRQRVRRMERMQTSCRCHCNCKRRGRSVVSFEFTGQCLLMRMRARGGLQVRVRARGLQGELELRRLCCMRMLVVREGIGRCG